ASVAEAGNRQSVLILQPHRKRKELLQPSARHHNILIQLGQTGVPQCVRKLTPNLPNHFAFHCPQTRLNKKRIMGLKKCLQRLYFTPNRSYLSVQLNNQVSPAASQPFATSALVSRRQSESVCQFEGGGEKPGVENRVQCPSCPGHGAEPHRHTRPTRRQRQQLQCGLGYQPKQPFRSHKEPVELETCFILVRAPSEANHSA